MKKLAAGLIASALLVPGAATTAFAGPDDGYPGTVTTQSGSEVPKHAKAGEKVKIKAELGVASNGEPCTGKFVLKVTKAGGGKPERHKKGTEGEDRTFSFTFDEPGKYFVKVRFIPDDMSPCKGSHTIKTVTVG
jgi:plastocyanin